MSKIKDYSLNIHHRRINIVSKDAKNNHYDDDCDHLGAGHFYLGLREDDCESFFSKYSTKGDVFSNLLHAKEIGTALGKTYNNYNLKLLKRGSLVQCINTKTISLTKQQFDKAKQTALTVIRDNTIEQFEDSTDFIQFVYHAVGLPLHFTAIYTSCELTSLKTAAARNVLVQYGSKDTFEHYFSSIAAPNSLELSKRLNIDEKAITLLYEPRGDRGNSYFSILVEKVNLPNDQQLSLSDIRNADEIKSQLSDSLITFLPYPLPNFLEGEKNWEGKIHCSLFYMNRKHLKAGPSLMYSELIQKWLSDKNNYFPYQYLNFIKFNEFIRPDEIANKLSSDLSKFKEDFVNLLIKFNKKNYVPYELEQPETTTFLKKCKSYLFRQPDRQIINKEHQVKLENQQQAQIQEFNKKVKEISYHFNEFLIETAHKFNFLKLLIAGRFPTYDIENLYNIDMLTQDFLQGASMELGLEDI